MLSVEDQSETDETNDIGGRARIREARESDAQGGVS